MVDIVPADPFDAPSGHDDGVSGKDPKKNSTRGPVTSADSTASGAGQGGPEIKTSSSSSSLLPSSLPPSAPPPSDAPADAGRGRFGKPRFKGEVGQIYVDDAGKRFKCYVYARGDKFVYPWYEVDESGSRKLGGSVRPPDTPAQIWSKMIDYQQI